MLFLTYWFVIFAAIAYPLYWVLRFPTIRLVILFIACAVFHAHFAGPAGVLPIVVLAIFVYLAGLVRYRVVCYFGIALCATSLIFYKYTKFLCTEVVGAFSPNVKALLLTSLPPWSLVPPLAISFFVFEFIHYLADVSRGGNSIKNPLRFGLFAIFWPSIVAGPVKRYQDFMPELLRSPRGQQSRCCGRLRARCRRSGEEVPRRQHDRLRDLSRPPLPDLDILERWFFLGCLSFRILLDFSGYSDMAIGFARMHGIRLMENFRWPYLATSIITFWHRWHISLSQWIRDYIYIALGGSRSGPLRKLPCTACSLSASAACGMAPAGTSSSGASITAPAWLSPQPTAHCLESLGSAWPNGSKPMGT